MSEKTEKKYAHDVVPHPKPGEPLPLADLVRYHYAQSQGWWLMFWRTIQDRSYGLPMDIALHNFTLHARLAFLHDALAQGLAGQDAADWASVRTHDESAELTYERGLKAGVDMDSIRAYEVRPEVSP